MACAEPLTRCQQAALDLQLYRDALANLLTGKRVVSVQEGDKRLDYYAAGNVGELSQLIRMKQLEVDRCNGCRGQRWIQMTPSDC